MKMRIFLLSALLAHPAMANPISLSNINMSQSKTDQILALLDQGFECTEEVLCEGLAGYVLCKNGEKKILPGEENVKFSCENFNACNYSLREVSQSLINEGLVKSVSYSVENFKDGSTNYLTEKYCDRGEDGDIVCATSADTLFGTKIIQIVIEKGSLGTGVVDLK